VRLGGRDNCLRPGGRAPWLWLALLTAHLFLPEALAEEAAEVKGLIFTIDPDRVQTVWPNARVSLVNLVTRNETATISDRLGEYTFTGVTPGEYEVRVALAGFKTLASQTRLEEGASVRLDFQLSPVAPGETVHVTGETGGVDLTSSSGDTPVLTAKVLESAVRLSEDFQQVLPLLPGVVRGPDGLLRIKGGRTNQTNALVNTASIADPFTGQPALRLPTVAVQSVRVISNPFSAEYGGFASGVVEVNTRGGTDQWRWLFEDPVPRPRWIHGSTHGIGSASPHFVFAGPIRRDKLYLFQSTSYNFDTTRVPSLPDPDNVLVEERFNTHTQIDWNITPAQRFTAVLTVDPQNTDFATIDTFNPQPVTADYRQRGFFSSGTHRWILASGGFIQSVFSAKRMDARVLPADSRAGEMILAPEANSGTYFERQDRRTRLYQWSQGFHLRPLEQGGRHLVTLGYYFAHASYRGSIANLPVEVMRGDGTLSQLITYEAPLSSDSVKKDWAAFVQDNWQVHPRLVLDLGLRLERDTLSADRINPAPRVGFVFAPARDDRTAVRGGIGVFFDKIPLNAAIFPDIPRQTVTRFGKDGLVVTDGPRSFTHVIATPNGRLRVPYSLGWTAQFDRRIRSGLFLRFSYEQREVFREIYVDPYEAADGSGELRLFTSGRQSYREFLGLLRWQATERTTVFASYVRSHASGELNDYSQFFGNFPYPLIRPNQRGRLAHDAPNRVLFWGVFGLPRKLEFVPVLDVHTGFPYSKVDQDWNFIGRRNEAGRFPTFFGLDVKLQYPFDFKFRSWHFKFRAGLKVFNVLNYYNPRDVQQHVGSTNFGVFYNSVGRLIRLEGDFDF
jgi:hypothetical protein